MRELGSLCNWACSVFQWQNTWACVELLLRPRAIWRKITCERGLKLKPMMWEKPHWNWKCYSFLNCSLLLLFCAARRSCVLFKDQFELPRSHSHTLTALRSAAARKFVICKLEKIYNHLIAKRRATTSRLLLLKALPYILISFIFGAFVGVLTSRALAIRANLCDGRCGDVSQAIYTQNPCVEHTRSERLWENIHKLIFPMTFNLAMRIIWCFIFRALLGGGRRPCLFRVQPKFLRGGKYFRFSFD